MENTTKYTEVQSYDPHKEEVGKLYELKFGDPNSNRVVVHLSEQEAKDLLQQLLAHVKPFSS